MKAERKRYGAEFKAKVALEAIKGQRTINEIAGSYGVHPSMVIQCVSGGLKRGHYGGRLCPPWTIVFRPWPAASRPSLRRTYVRP